MEEGTQDEKPPTQAVSLDQVEVVESAEEVRPKVSESKTGCCCKQELLLKLVS